MVDGRELRYELVQGICIGQIAYTQGHIPYNWKLYIKDHSTFKKNIIFSFVITMGMIIV